MPIAETIEQRNKQGSDHLAVSTHIYFPELYQRYLKAKEKPVK